MLKRYSAVYFLQVPFFMVSLGFQIHKLLYPFVVFILSFSLFDLSLAKSWSGNPKLQDTQTQSGIFQTSSPQMLLGRDSGFPNVKDLLTLGSEFVTCLDCQPLVWIRLVLTHEPLRQELE